MLADPRPMETAIDPTVPLWQPGFLDALAKTSDVRLSCKLAQVSAPTVYQRRRENPAFAYAWDCAMASCREREQQRVRRKLAYHGIP